MSEPEAIFVTAAGRKHLLDRHTRRGETHLAPIVELLAKGIAITAVAQSWTLGRMRFPAPLRKRAWLAIVGDDLFTAEGPAGFHLRSLRKLVERAHFISVMSGEAVREAYQTAADIAEAGANVIVIETQPSEEASWLEFVYRHAPNAVKHLVSPNAKFWRNAA